MEGSVEAVLTVTLKLQDDELQLLEAVQVTTVVPAAKVDPEAGVQITVAAGDPDAVGVLKVTTGLQVVISEGQDPMTGLSLIVTLNEQEAVLQLLEAVQLTTVVPVAKLDPEAGEQFTEGEGVPVAAGLL